MCGRWCMKNEEGKERNELKEDSMRGESIREMSADPRGSAKRDVE